MASEQAMRAARAWLNDTMRFPTYELGSVEHLADLIDREAGLPELIAASADWQWNYEEQVKLVASLRARLAAVEALHAVHGQHNCGHCEYRWPCPTLRAARGEHE